MSAPRARSWGRGTIVVLAALVVLVVGGCSGGGDGDAVDYEVTELRSGDPVSVESLRGSPALLVSWATWCRECDEELAGLQEFAESDEAEGIQIVAVNLDAADVQDDIDAKVARHGLTVDLWRDRRNEFKRTFGALGVPTTVLLDAEGRIVDTFAGAVDFADTDVIAALDEVRATS